MNRKVYLDTNIFVEAFERVDRQSPIWKVLNAIEGGELDAITSEITFAELLPKLIIDGEADLIALYERLFSEGGIFDAVPITREVLFEAARIRAVRLSVRLPDAIHLATAVHAGCSVVLSNDQRLGSITQLPVVATGPDCLAKINAITP